MSRTVTPKAARLMQQGIQLMQASAFVEAGRAFERAAQQMPDLADAHAMRADALMRAGKLEAALSAADRALRLAPGWGEASMLRGNILALMARFADAEAAYRQAMNGLGETASLLTNLGKVLLEQHRFEEALEAFEAALGERDSAELFVLRARALDRLSRTEACEQAWRRVLERDPQNLEALERLANLGLTIGDYELVEEVCRAGMTLAPDAPSFHLGLAVALEWLGRETDESLAHFAQAEERARDADDVRAQAVVGKATALLLRSRLRAGWEAYFHHLPRGSLTERYPRLALKPDEVASLRERTVCIHPVQGIGDQLFFLRFAVELKARGNRLLLKTHPKLAPLLSSRRDLFDWVGRDENESPDYDVDLLVSDLPLASPEKRAPPLELPLDAERRHGIEQRLMAFGPPPYIGVTWRGGLTPEEQRAWGGRIWSKFLPPGDLGAVLRRIRGTVVVVQRHPRLEEAAALEQALGKKPFDASWVNDDLRDAVALLSTLSEYVGVSNTNMHLLAGLQNAGGRVMVTAPPEWRWGAEGETSPWFPRFRLYRQAARAGWGPALCELQAHLQASPL